MATLELSQKRVVVLGLGESGFQAARLLASKGAQVTVRDTGNSASLKKRATDLGELGIRAEVGTIPETTDFDLAVLSPGIDPATNMVKTVRDAHVRMLGELELGYRFCQAPVVAITGTNGKTTTTELITAILKAAGRRAPACGNIGKPLSAVAIEGGQNDALVVEVSSYQLEAIEEFRANVAVYLNFTPDHLDRYPGMKEYRDAKWNIFRNQTSADFAVVNTRAELPVINAQRVTFDAYGGPADYTFSNGELMSRGETVCTLAATKLIGAHNAENLLAAIAVSEILKVPRETIVAAICAYNPQSHRCETVAEIDGVLFINDSKATNIDAVEKALMSVTRPIVLIAGGKDKGLDFSPLTELVRERVKHLVLIGEMKPALRKLWGGVLTCTDAETLPEAVTLARAAAQKGDAVLLSPGCSSFDMFRNYVERGEIFRQAVLAEKNK